jgi:hypothetical protein
VSHAIADELEARLGRGLAEFAVTQDVGGALSRLCSDLVEAVRDLEDIRGTSPQRLSDLVKATGDGIFQGERGPEDFISEMDADVLEYLPQLAELDLSTIPKFWIRKTSRSQETIPLGLRDLEVWTNGVFHYETFIIASAPSEHTGPVDVYLGNRHVGTSTKAAGDAIRREALAAGSNLVVIPCTVVTTNGVWSIVVDGEE